MQREMAQGQDMTLKEALQALRQLDRDFKEWAGQFGGERTVGVE